MKMTKRILSMLMAVIMILSCWVWIAPEQSIANAATLTGDSNYLFAYFTGTSLEGQTIHLAVSQDGLNYTALRNNEPVIIPSKGTGCVRDPYIWYNEQDGYYYILATDLDFTDTGGTYSDNSESFIIWRSKDLVNWYDETMIDVKALLGEFGIANTNMQAVWAPQVLWDGTSYVVYFSLQCDYTSNGSWNNLQIVYLRTTDLLDQDAYYEFGDIYDPQVHVIDADIIKKPDSEQYYMFYKAEADAIQSIYYLVSDNGPLGPYYAPNNENDGKGPKVFPDLNVNIEGCNSFFDDNGNLITYVDEYEYTNASGQTEAHFHVSSTSDFSTFTKLDESSYNINSLSPRHGSVVKITDEEYNRLLNNANGITSSSFPETEVLSDHLVGRYFTTSDYTYNAANGKNDLTLTDGSITMSTEISGKYYADFNNAGAQVNLADLISGDLNIKDGFTITFSATVPSSLGSNARFFDISNNWSQRADASECYLHMSPVADSNGLYVGAFNGPNSTTSWTWASQGNNYNDGFKHDYVISFADGNMIMYIDGELAMKRDRYNMNAEYGDNFLTDNWYKEIGNSVMRIGKSEWDDPLFTGSIQNLCIYDCSLSYYDAEEMQTQFDIESGTATMSRIVVPETVYMTPSTGASTTGQYYVNNTINDDGSNIVDVGSGTSEKGIIQFYIPGAESFSVEVNTITSGIGDIVLTEAGTTSGTYENTTFSANDNGYFTYSSIGFYINGTGISAGNTALAEWKITVNMNDGSTRVYYAYSTLYAPYYQPVAAAAEAWSSSTRQSWAGSILWVSGVHGYSASSITGGSTRYPNTTNFLPMLGLITEQNNTRPSGAWLDEAPGAPDPTANYIESNGSYHRRANSVSPMANLTVDTSRYTNFNQIPNFKVGFIITDSEDSDEGSWYVADYTGYTADISNGGAGSDTKSDVGSDFYDRACGTKLASGDDKNCELKYNGTWDKGIVTGTVQLKSALRTENNNYAIKKSAWNYNFIQMNVTGVDKTLLRNLVLKATYLNEKDYTAESWSAMQTELRTAAEALGNPSNADIDTAKSNLQTKMDALQTTVTLNANGGTINGGETTSFNVTVGLASTYNYDVSSYTPVLTGYVFNGWATSATATNGSTTVTAGLMPTLYAVWAPEKVNITFDNMFDFSTFEIGTGSLTVNERTETGFTITSTTGTDANTGFSYPIPVESGKTYIFSADVSIECAEGDVKGFDMYINTLDSSLAGETSATVDTSNGAHKEGDVYISLTGQTEDVAGAYIKFTAGATTEYIKVRFDANTEGNKLTVNNIRIYEANDITYSGVANTYATYDSAYPSTSASAYKEGYDFMGWYDGVLQYYDADGKAVISAAFDKTETIYLTSKFGLNNGALTADKIIIDFDKPVTFKPAENDTILNNDADAFYIKGISTDGTVATLNQTELKGTYGDIELDNAGYITYTPTKALDGIEIIYYHIAASYEGAQYTLVGEINIIPASNVLYEEDNFTTTNTTGVAWETDGTAGTASQTTESTVYGYDTVYNSVGTYSNGSALKVTVDSTNKRAQIQSFTFNGTGFDLYGQCGSNTGIMVVTVKDGSGKAIKASIVDTYYNGSYGTLNQVPIVGYAGDWGTYTVQVSSMYLASAGAVKATQTQSVMGFDDMMAYSAPLTGAQMLYEALAEVGMEDVFEAEELDVVWFDDDSIFNGGNGANTLADTQTASTSTTSTATTLTCVIDSIRVYTPIETGDAFYSDSEQGAQYVNIMDNLVNGGVVSGNGNAAYINMYTVDGDNTEVDFDTYELKGSKEEIYLATATNALTFDVLLNSTDAKIMVSMRAASGTPVAKIGEEHFTVNSSTEMYYDITNYAEITTNEETGDITATVTIQNTGENSLLAIDNIKLTGNVAMLSTFSLLTARRMMTAESEEVEPNTSTPEVEDTTTDTETDSDASTQEDENVSPIIAFFNKLAEFFKKIFESITSLFGI